MIRLRTATGDTVNAESMECTAEDARRLCAALAASTSTSPYGVVRLAIGMGLRQVLVVSDRAAEPKPAHKAIEP